VSAPPPPRFAWSVLTEIHACHARSCQEIVESSWKRRETRRRELVEAEARALLQGLPASLELVRVERSEAQLVSHQRPRRSTDTSAQLTRPLK
jgi:hypothetical protein